MTRFLLHLFLIGIATNLDNLGVGLVYGLRRIKVPPLSNLAIALTALVFGYISALAGSALRHFLAGSFANLLGALLLIGMGIWIMIAQEGCRTGGARKRATTVEPAFGPGHPPSAGAGRPGRLASHQPSGSSLPGCGRLAQLPGQRPFRRSLAIGRPADRPEHGLFQLSTIWLGTVARRALWRGLARQESHGPRRMPAAPARHPPVAAGVGRQLTCQAVAESSMTPAGLFRAESDACRRSIFPGSPPIRKAREERPEVG